LRATQHRSARGGPAKEESLVTKRRYALVVPLLAAGMFVAACGSSGGSKGGSSDNKKTYTIGFQGPLSGGNAALGINEKFGVALAIKEANEKGDLPFKLAVVNADDLGSGDGGRRRRLRGRVPQVRAGTRPDADTAGRERLNAMLETRGHSCASP